mmetsp:Transcript_12114/g.35827  ORF Transcript_12114/g.35827 Transcript_12114/m.35827 type:complete len:674 (-) Transcript_12114:1170-3191(-)
MLHCTWASQLCRRRRGVPSLPRLRCRYGVGPLRPAVTGKRRKGRRGPAAVHAWVLEPPKLVWGDGVDDATPQGIDCWTRAKDSRMARLQPCGFDERLVGEAHGVALLGRGGRRDEPNAPARCCMPLRLHSDGGTCGARLAPLRDVHVEGAAVRPAVVAIDIHVRELRDRPPNALGRVGIDGNFVELDGEALLQHFLEDGVLLDAAPLSRNGRRELLLDGCDLLGPELQPQRFCLRFVDDLVYRAHTLHHHAHERAHVLARAPGRRLFLGALLPELLKAPLELRSALGHLLGRELGLVHLALQQVAPLVQVLGAHELGDHRVEQVDGLLGSALGDVLLQGTLQVLRVRELAQELTLHAVHVGLEAGHGGLRLSHAREEARHVRLDDRVLALHVLTQRDHLRCGVGDGIGQAAQVPRLRLTLHRLRVDGVGVGLEAVHARRETVIDESLRLAEGGEVLGRGAQSLLQGHARVGHRLGECVRTLFGAPQLVVDVGAVEVHPAAQRVHVRAEGVEALGLARELGEQGAQLGGHVATAAAAEEGPGEQALDPIRRGPHLQFEGSEGRGGRVHLRHLQPLPSRVALGAGGRLALRHDGSERPRVARGLAADGKHRHVRRPAQRGEELGVHPPGHVQQLPKAGEEALGGEQGRLGDALPAAAARARALVAQGLAPRGRCA